ncbi:glutamate--cysteine ligase [Catenuloplanes nepalensis]|uniref:Glutamate--cysteine ligase EgtA n=1 Tax=Catenuloplanes nepalensis TaxID=587533 RepID=A0ABT9MRG7_9ACTN|nr:ergothioneine biosynthesis glutamate--cysteine ligase EgtA [Catenuloplanes nepalensis]MDP9793891.1 glutamate--cysteine ligase [Catenuloplanes nepalensis]
MLELSAISDAAEHVSGICFKTGPPRRVGVELEWTVHHAASPSSPLTTEHLRDALGPYAPGTLGNPAPAQDLPGGGTVTVEPGGQVELSSAPAASLAGLYDSVEAGRAELTAHLARAGLRLGGTGLDPHRPPRRLLHTPRYGAMQRLFDRRGEHGRIMMCSTAGLQVCLDAGRPGDVARRWAAVHEFGPPLLAAFATSRFRAGRDTGWACGRMATWYGMEPGLTRPVGTGADPAATWARYALAAPLLCLRRDDGDWDAPPGLTFAGWIRGRLPRPPTVEDLEYHLGTLFPPVRPRGYLEIRYLDAQPGDEWIAPAAVLTALLDDAVLDRARDLAAPARDRWQEAAREGLACPAVGAAASALLDLACRNLDRTGLPARLRDRVAAISGRRLSARPVRSPDREP